MISKSTAVLAVADVQQTIDFYVSALGFKQHWLWGDPPTFACIGMGKIELFLSLRPNLVARIETHGHYFWVEDLPALHAQHLAAGAPVIEPMENKPWGIREYTVRDCNGYHLRFAGPQIYERPATATDVLPPHIRIDQVVPDYTTYASLFASVGWALHESSMREALRNTLVGVTATDLRDGQIVGMVRATGDGKYYMIWDVIVRPSHQGQKIGSTMLARTMDELRKSGAPQGAFVGLFASKTGFYEQAGFQKDIGMHQAL
jgi:catechol 2,3-dioxygenase-like lactoylglutathione lyase family enzyme